MKTKINLIPDNIDKEVQEQIAVMLFNTTMIDFTNSLLSNAVSLIKDKDCDTIFKDGCRTIATLTTAISLYLDYLKDTENDKYIGSISRSLKQVINDSVFHSLIEEEHLDYIKFNVKETLNSGGDEYVIARKCVCFMLIGITNGLLSNGIFKYVSDFCTDENNLNEQIKVLEMYI